MEEFTLKEFTLKEHHLELVVSSSSLIWPSPLPSNGLGSSGFKKSVSSIVFDVLRQLGQFELCEFKGTLWSHMSTSGPFLTLMGDGSHAARVLSRCLII